MSNQKYYDRLQKRKKVLEETLENPENEIEYQDISYILEMNSMHRKFQLGHSDLTEGQIISHVGIAEDFEYEDVLSKRANDRVKRTIIKNDLALYYRYNNKMLKLRIKVIDKLTRTNTIFRVLFGKYGRDARFRVKISKTSTAIVSFEILLRMELHVQDLTKSFLYILAAKGMRSPYGGIGSGPISMAGIYKPLMISHDAVIWLRKEPNLANLKEYYEMRSEYEDSFLFSGIMTRTVYEMIFREALNPNKLVYSKKEKENAASKKIKLSPRYEWTVTMKKYLLPTDKYLYGNTFKKFISGTIDKNAKIEIVPPYDPTDEAHRQFLEEMAIVQDYFDQQSLKKEKPNVKRRQTRRIGENYEFIY